MFFLPRILPHLSLVVFGMLLAITLPGWLFSGSHCWRAGSCASNQWCEERQGQGLIQGGFLFVCGWNKDVMRYSTISPLLTILIMQTIPIADIINAVLGLTRDCLLYFAPLIGLLGGLKFITDWVHKIIFGKKYNASHARVSCILIGLFGLLFLLDGRLSCGYRANEKEKNNVSRF